MAVNLTGGAIAMLCNGEAQEAELKPVLQVTDIRLVNTQQQSANERYRILLSDGSFLQQGMLATQMNYLVKSGKLQKGSIVKLTQFVCNVIQGRMIIIIIDLDVLLEKCDPIGEPKQYAQGGATGGPAASATRPSVSIPPSVNQSGISTGNTQSYGGGSLSSGQLGGQNVAGGVPLHVPKAEPVPSYGSSYSGNPDSGQYSAPNGTRIYPKTDVGSAHPESAKSPMNYSEKNQSFRSNQVEGSRVTMNTYSRPMQPPFQQPPPMYTNRGPIAKNEAPTRIIPIAALNPYQGRWTIKARVTAKGDLRHYNNPRGDGKVFSFDLLDSDGGEIRVTCFNAVADQFYNQIEAGKVYLISRGSLRPAQKNFNHLNNDHEILLESSSTVQPCFEDDNSIPRQQFHFRPISDVEGLENNAIVDIIGVVSSINPSASIMRKNGIETYKRTLQLKDMSGRSCEITFWGNFCNAEGQRLQDMRDSGAYPILAVKAGRINDFSGKSVGTIASTQLFIDPDFPEARKLKEWFLKEGKNTPSISISRETSGAGRTDVRKTVSQIKDEKLGTSEKPDWITISVKVTFIKVDNFCYTACPIMIGDRQCNKKVVNNGDGKWRCDRCDQCVDECDYRYILQMQVQDHTGLTWVTAFQESGEDIMGISAKDLFYLKYEEQDDEKFSEIIRNVLFSRFLFKLKVKEETFSDEQRVKSTVVKAERVNFSSESMFLLALIDKLQGGDTSAFAQKAATNPDSAISYSAYGGMGVRSATPPAVNYLGSSGGAGRNIGLPANQMGHYGNQYSSERGTAGATGVYLHCNSCGGTGHTSQNCPSVSVQGQPMGGGFINRAPSAGVSGGGTSGECYKCHQVGHWARDCPGPAAVNSAYGSSGIAGRYGSVPKQHVVLLLCSRPLNPGFGAFVSGTAFIGRVERLIWSAKGNMEFFFKGLSEATLSNEQCSDLPDIQRCPFLRNINEPTNFSFSPRNFPLPRREAKGPIFEDGPNFDMAFRLFHGKDGVVPLSGGSYSHSKNMEPEPAAHFNPLAAKAATISLSAFGPGGPFSFNFFSEKWKNQEKKSKGSDSLNHEAVSNEWLETGNCPIAKSYRAVSHVLPIVVKALQPPPGMKVKCPPAIVAARAALSRTAFVKTLRPQALPEKMLVIGLLGMAANVPLGIWREHTRKFSPSWFVAVHAAVPFIAMLRKSVLMPKTAMAFTIAASVLGQVIGSRAERIRLKAIAQRPELLSQRESTQSVIGKLSSGQVGGITSGHSGAQKINWDPLLLKPAETSSVVCF
ncbi:hypothetical protein NE237_027685 [Protea cynaroides]|uniref:Replication protein A subunit n=1 Tax=Protea cynaroides TaxID=273540 RepID=A0A9Q0JUL8_9MAGN|nr:hypothetical protein NE237_027685 [Protea cynaroides]